MPCHFLKKLKNILFLKCRPISFHPVQNCQRTFLTITFTGVSFNRKGNGMEWQWKCRNVAIETYQFCKFCHQDVAINEKWDLRVWREIFWRSIFVKLARKFWISVFNKETPHYSKRYFFESGLVHFSDSRGLTSSFAFSSFLGERCS